MNNPPKVFISYSHDSDAHVDRVLAFADALRNDQVEAIIDRNIPNPPEGWPHWMSHHLDTADFVLLICTKEYHDRVERRQPAGTGRGVQWEGTIIYNRIYNNPNVGDRFIPILIDGGIEDNIPMPLRGFTFYRIADFALTDPSYEDLYRHLTGQPANPATPLGVRKVLPPRMRGGGVNPP